MSRRIAAIALAVTGLLGLTACSGFPLGSPVSTTVPADAPGDEGQSIEEACQLIQDTITEASTEFEQSPNEDPAAVVAAMKAAGQKLADTASQITNDEVAAIMPALQQMFEQVGEVMAAIVEGDDTRVDELKELGQTFRETSEKFQDLCVG